MLKSIVMVKNDGAIKDTTASDEKPTVYVPLVWMSSEVNNGWDSKGSASYSFPFDMDYLSQYCNVVTDKVAETLTGEAGRDGNPTPAYEDIIRATPEELAECDFALVFVNLKQPVSVTTPSSRKVAESGDIFQPCETAKR